MKKVLIICLALMTISLQAQTGGNEGKQHRKGKDMNYTPEQIAELKTKRMVLQLDLTEQQEKKVYDLVLEKAKKRKELRDNNKGKKDESMSFEKKKQMLDDRIEMKKAFKAILTKEQYEKWEVSLTKKNRRKMKDKKQKSKG